MLTELLRHLRANSIKNKRNKQKIHSRSLVQAGLNFVWTSPLEGREPAFFLYMLK